jgi:D-sedoheptulose 7-phosphate isomerase
VEVKGYPTYASATEYFDKVNELLHGMSQASESFVDALWRGFEEDRTIFLVGNGGSAANASHFGQDLAKGTLSSMDATRRFRVIALTDNIGFITALANDEGYDSIFEQQLRNLARPGDLLVAISGSGNSPNVIRAVEYARSIDMKVIGVTGYDGGKLLPLSDVSVHVPIVDMGMTEAIHAVIFHLAMNQLRTKLAGAQ